MRFGFLISLFSAECCAGRFAFGCCVICGGCYFLCVALFTCADLDLLLVFVFAMWFVCCLSFCLLVSGDLFVVCFLWLGSVEFVVLWIWYLLLFACDLVVVVVTWYLCLCCCGLFMVI